MNTTQPQPLQSSRGALGRWVAARRATLTAAPAEAGFTLIELLVAMVIAVVLGGLAAMWIHSARQSTGDLVEETAQWDSMNSASTMLKEDVRDSWVIRTGTASEFVALIRRTDPAPGGGTRCAVRDWKIDPTAGSITMTSTVYENTDCTGDHADPVTWTTIPRVDASSKFVYRLHDSGRTIDGDVESGKDLGIVQWTWTTQPHADHTAGPGEQLLSFTASAVANADGSDPAARSTAIQAQASILTVTTTPEGRAQPQLTWTNPNPAGVVRSWVIMRAAWPEGDDAANAAAVWGNFDLVGDPTTLTWTDPELKPGWTARYAVYPTLNGAQSWNTGPLSNTVTTGLRPATVTNVVATGSRMWIGLTWDKTVGATSYDVYRDGQLVAWTTGNAATSFRDGSSTYSSGPLPWPNGEAYGHAHAYNVVAVNRWENRLTTGTQGTQLVPGPTVTSTTSYAGALRNVSADTPAAGAFTQPRWPVITVIPDGTWGFTITWTPAPWVGAGPTSKDGVSRDRGWTVKTNGSNTATPNGTWSPEWAGAENAPGTTSRVVPYAQGEIAGQYRTYTASTCNAIGCSVASVAVTALQRPPTPTCTATASSTRAVTVLVDRPAIVSTYLASQVSGGVQADGAPSITGLGITSTPSFGIDGLKHATSQAFMAANQNASPANSGWSDPVSCVTTTPALGISITGASSTTRSVTATAAATNGTSQTIGLSGGSTFAGLTGTWDGLTDGTGFTVTATNTDGVNDVQATAPVSTALLATPAAPNCSLTVTSATTPGIIKISGGAQVKLGSGGSAYASPQTYAGLAAGSYAGYARNTASDGVNTNYSGWSSCGNGTILPNNIGDAGPGYNSSSECNASIGQAAATLDAELASLGARIGDPVPGHTAYTLGGAADPTASHAGDYQYGVTKSGSVSAGNLSCTMYRAYNMVDGFGGVTGSFFWISAGWSLGGGAV